MRKVLEQQQQPWILNCSVLQSFGLSDIQQNTMSQKCHDEDIYQHGVGAAVKGLGLGEELRVVV